jgi:type II secretory pathway pseudopilin PulG
MGFRNRKKLYEERGIAMALVLAVLLVATVLAAVAASAAIRANHQTFRDRNSKRAFQAAVAGVESAIYQATLMQPPPTRCVIDTSGTLSVADSPGPWCPPQTKNVGDGATYTQYISEGTPYDDPTTGQHLVFREIVSTGVVNNVTRRLDLKVNAASAAPLFSTNFAVVSLDPITWGNAVRAFGNVGSNGDITLKNDARICGPPGPGNALPGAGPPPKKVILSGTASVCGTTTAATNPFVLNPVDVPVQNDNHRIDNMLALTRTPPLPPPYPSEGSDTCTTCGRVSWTPTTKVLSLSNNATLTLGGGVYVFCKVTLSNSSKLRIASGASVKVYIDSPEHCATAGSGAGSVTMTQSSTLENGNPGNPPNPSAFQLYMVGSTNPATPTSLEFANAATGDVVLAVYAPNSAVHLQNGVHFFGALAAKSIPIDNGATITYDPRIGSIVEGVIPVYRATRSWRECTTKPTGAAVNSGCWDD